jgi:hypothetical protein
MSETEAGLHVLHRVLLVLLVCLALFLVGCSGDPECFAVPFLPKCFDDDDDDEEKPNDTATQASALGSRPSPSDLSPWLREGSTLAPEHRHAAAETPAPRESEGRARDS